MGIQWGWVGDTDYRLWSDFCVYLLRVLVLMLVQPFGDLFHVFAVSYATVRSIKCEIGQNVEFTDLCTL